MAPPIRPELGLEGIRAMKSLVSRVSWVAIAAGLALLSPGARWVAAAEDAPALAPAAAPESQGIDDWVRVARDDRDRPAAMQTAIVRYTGRHAPTGAQVAVDLIGAVHVGDAAYYEALNQRFTKYDASPGAGKGRTASSRGSADASCRLVLL